MDQYPQIEVTRKTGKEQFHAGGKATGRDLLSFWQWSTSDLVGNAMRGILAEYIVASAVDQTGGNRTEWDAYDIKTSDGIKIEIKSAAYIQSWSQQKLSSIQFSIRETKGWDAAENTHSVAVERQSDVYVFCVLSHKEQETIDPLNLDQWDFYVLSTKVLNREVGRQKTLSLSRLESLNPAKVAYENLRSAIREAAKGNG